MGYEVLRNQMQSVICNLPAGTEFAIKDIISNPPARLGRTLFEEVQNGTIKNVQCLGKVDGVEQYKKL